MGGHCRQYGKNLVLLSSLQKVSEFCFNPLKSVASRNTSSCRPLTGGKASPGAVTMTVNQESIKRLPCFFGLDSNFSTRFLKLTLKFEH